MRLEHNMSDIDAYIASLREEVNSLRKENARLREQNGNLQLGPKAYVEPVEAEEIREMLRGFISGNRISRDTAAEMMEALGISNFETVRVKANLIAEFSIQIDKTLLDEEDAREAIAAHLRSQVEFDEEGYSRHFQSPPLTGSTAAEIEIDTIEIDENA